MKKQLISLIVLFAFGKVFAQDDAQFTQFYANKLYYNPAATGYSDKLIGSAAYRMQWAGSPSVNAKDRPSYMLFNAAQYIDDYRSGVGVSIYNARQHVQNTFQVKAAYAYHLQLNEDAFLSMGLNVGLMSKGVKNGLAPDGNPISETFTMSDLGFGLEFYMQEFQVGVSTQHIPAILGAKEEREHTHFYYYGTYFHVIDEDWIVIPSVVFRNSSFITNVDLSARVSYQNMYQLGVAWRRDAISVLIGLTIQETFSLGYSFDIHNSSLAAYRAGNRQSLRPSHEIMLTYRHQLLNRDSGGYGSW